MTVVGDIDPANARFRYLDIYLSPLVPFLEQDDITDIYINRPGELWIERFNAAPERLMAPQLTEEALWRLARQIANLTHQGISREHPLLAATLPDGSRVQIVAPPASRGDMAIAIRKHIVEDLSLGDYAESGALDEVSVSSLGAFRKTSKVVLSGDSVDMLAFLRDAVRARRNVVISGGTSTGKTTFLNALIKEIPSSNRLILIEDTPEVRIAHPNAVGLIATKGELGEARVTADDLLQASLRMRPDRIILGELRGAEAYTFLRAVNTGHPGSMTTIHADSPEGAVDQLALIVLQSGVQLSKADIVDYVRSTVDLIVQLARVDDRRQVVRVADTGK